MIHIGDSLTLEMINDENVVDKYRSKLVEKTGNQLYIDYPINVKTNKTGFFMGGTKLKVSFISKTDSSVYEFDTEIKGRKKLGNIPVIILEYPDKEKLHKVQRREFVRVETAIDVAIHPTDGSFSPFTTVTSDISAGGTAIILPPHHRLKQNQEITVWFAFSLANGEFHYLKQKCRVIRIIKPKEGRDIAPLQFLEITEAQQQIVFKLCFDRQVEMRKKGIT